MGRKSKERKKIKGDKPWTPFAFLDNKANWIVVLILVLPLLQSVRTIDHNISIRFLAQGIFIVAYVLYFYVVKKDNITWNFPRLVNLVFLFSILYLLWAAVGWFWAPNSAELIYDVSRFALNLALLFLVMLAVMDQEFNWNRVFLSILYVAAIHVLIGFDQYFNWEITSFRGVDEPFGAMINRNLYGSFLMMLVPLVIYTLLANGLKKKPIALLLFCALLAAIFYSQTRSAWVATLISLGFASLLILVAVKTYQKSLIYIWLATAFAIATLLLVNFWLAPDKPNTLAKSKNLTERSSNNSLPNQKQISEYNNVGEFEVSEEQIKNWEQAGVISLSEKQLDKWKETGKFKPTKEQISAWRSAKKTKTSALNQSEKITRIQPADKGKNRSISFDRFDERAFRSIDERMIVWRETSQLISDYPIAGVGAGNWKIVIPNYSNAPDSRMAYGEIVSNRPHNAYLRVLSETGIVGFILFFIPWILLLIMALKMINTVSEEPKKLLILVITTALLGLAADAFFSFPLERIEHSVLQMFLMGSLMGLFVQQWQVKQETSNSTNIRWLWIPIGLLAVWSCYLGNEKYQFEYHMNRARVHYVKNRHQWVPDEVEKGKSRFVNLEINNDPIELVAALSLNVLKRYEESLVQLEIAQKHNPYSTRIWSTKGNVFTELKQHDKAIECYTQALVYSPRHEVSLKNLAVNYYFIKDYQACLNTLARFDFENDEMFTRLHRAATARLKEIN